MPPIEHLAVILIFGIPVLYILGWIFLSAIKIIFGDNSSKEKKSLNAEETRIIQEIYQSLERMEKRIETLETLMLSKD